jgi:hypothetical protein
LVLEKLFIVGWNVESGVILTMAGTHLSFLPTHLIDNNRHQKDLVALNPSQWQFSSEFSLVLKSHPDTLSPAALAFYHCLLTLSPL